VVKYSAGGACPADFLKEKNNNNQLWLLLAYSYSLTSSIFKNS